jgi:hypothetical protein
MRIFHYEFSKSSFITNPLSVSVDPPTRSSTFFKHASGASFRPSRFLAWIKATNRN